MAVLQGSSSDIVSSHLSNLDDDLSLYSISEESNLHHNLSDLYDMLGDDSIEIRRSESMTESPFKTSSPLKFSPTKKLKNDYQDHVFRARSGSSPTKKRGGTSFLDATFDNLNETNSYDSIERNIEHFLADRTIQRSSPILDMDIGDFDKTELIIKETHKLINNVPDSIVGNKEGEKFSRLLNTSITQLIKSLESVKRENHDLKQVNSNLKEKNTRAVVEKLALEESLTKSKQDKNRLEDELASARRNAASLKDENQQLHRKISQQVPQQNAQIKRENSLLREKLIKYKNLTEETRKENDRLKKKLNENPVPEIQAIPVAEPKEAGKGKLEEIFQQLSDHLDKEKQEEEKPKSSNYTYKVLPFFEELIDNMKKEQRGSETSDDKQIPNAQKNSVKSNGIDKDERLLRKVLATMDINNELYTRILQVVNHDDHDGINNKTTNNNSAMRHDVVVRCYCGGEEVSERNSVGIDQEQQVKGLRAKHGGKQREYHQGPGILHPHTQEEDVFTEASEGLEARGSACPRCSAGARNDTVNLMGEYKWSI